METNAARTDLMAYVPFVVFAAHAGIVALIGFASRGIRPNSVVGVRNRYTKQSASVWREANSRCLRLLGWGATAVAVLSLAGMLHPSRTTLFVLMGLSLLAITVFAIYTQWLSRELYLSVAYTAGPEATVLWPCRGKHTLDVRPEAVPLATIAATTLVTWVLYSQMPGQIPIHYDLTGQPDRWVERTWLSGSLLILVQLIVYGAFLTSRLVARRSTYSELTPTSDRGLTIAQNVTLAALGLMQSCALLGYLSKVPSLVPLFVLGVTIVPLVILWRWARRQQRDLPHGTTNSEPS